MDKVKVEKLLSETVRFVKESLHSAEGGHDWLHTERVWNNARQIGSAENANLIVVELASILHDVADSKFHDGDEELGAIISRQFLDKQGLDSAVIEDVVYIIRHISFKGGQNNEVGKSIEFKVVQDADRLDAIGAVGIARCFNYGGYKNRPIFDPTCPPKMNQSKEEYKNSVAPSINHFYEKLIRLEQLMNTETGRNMAKRRNNFMLSYLKQFFDEVGISENQFLHQL